MPLPGGPSDKAGNSYERRWTVFALIDLLAGQAQALRIEVPGDEGRGSEFRLTVGSAAEWHQAKRQRAAGPWTVSALIAEGVLKDWQPNLDWVWGAPALSADGRRGETAGATTARLRTTGRELLDGRLIAQVSVRRACRTDRLG